MNLIKKYQLYDDNYSYTLRVTFFDNSIFEIEINEPDNEYINEQLDNAIQNKTLEFRKKKIRKLVL